MKYFQIIKNIMRFIVGGDMGTAHEAKSDVTASIEILDKLIDTKGEYELI